MGKINKAIIAPIVALVAMMLKMSLGIEMSNEGINIAVDGILAIVAFAGILINPSKEG